MFAYIDGPYPYYTVLFYALLFGLGAGLFYECFRILRCAVNILLPAKRKTFRVIHLVAVFFEDLLFFLVLSAFGILFLYGCNRGQLRISILLAMGVGFAVYLLTLGKWVFRLHSLILYTAHRVLVFLYRHTLYYVLIFLRFLYKRTVGKLLKKIKIILNHYYRKILLRRHARQFSRLLDSAKNGFEGMGDHI